METSMTASEATAVRTPTVEVATAESTMARARICSASKMELPTLQAMPRRSLGVFDPPKAKYLRMVDSMPYSPSDAISRAPM